MLINLNSESWKKIFLILTFLPIISFCLGFYFDENSAGAGGYNGDITWIKKNIDIFLNNDLRIAVLHPDFFGNRTPLIYILQKFFNPYFDNYEMYRVTSFIISLLGPIIFFLLLKKRFHKTQKSVLFLLASLVYLSPYYRTSAYWGLNENYGIITSIISFYFLIKIKETNYIKFIDLSQLIFFSSLSVYFDLKLAIVPLTAFLTIIFSNFNFKTKSFVLFSFLILSTPYLFLINYWGGIVPFKTQSININTITSLEDINKLYFIHIGYAATLISFYILPIIFLTSNNIVLSIKNMFYKKETYFFSIIVLAFIFYHFLFFNFEKFTTDDYWIGLGVVHKLSILVTNKFILREIITYFFFFTSFMLILYYFYLDKLNTFYLSYFLFISLLLWPLMQEYFDPVILILALSLFKPIKYLNRKNTLINLAYFSIFLIIANIYYS